MRELIIHIGYPKTGTTTIQNALFTKLHDDNIINYLGLAQYSKNPVFSVKNRISKYLFLNEKVNEHIGLIKYNMINVLSDEGLTVYPYIREVKFKQDVIDPFSFPKKLNELFVDKVDTIRILVGIRNQVDLIYSMYVEKYQLLKDSKNIDNFEEHIFYSAGRVNQERFRTLYFSSMIQEYEDVFGKENVHILFYEDYLNDFKEFAQELSKALGISDELVQSYLKDKYYNIKNKSDTGTYAEYRRRNYTKFYFKKVVTHKLAVRFYQFIKSRWPNIRLAKRLKSIRTYDSEEILIRKLSPEERMVIFYEFAINNQGLFNNSGVNKEKLIKYGYI